MWMRKVAVYLQDWKIESLKLLWRVTRKIPLKLRAFPEKVEHGAKSDFARVVGPGTHFPSLLCGFLAKLGQPISTPRRHGDFFAIIGLRKRAAGRASVERAALSHSTSRLR